MEHQHQHRPETQLKKDSNGPSKIDHSTMHRGHNPSMGMEGHDHALMIADFKRRFYIVLILTVPIVLLSPMIQKFIGVDWDFEGSKYILFALSSVVFFYGGWPFLKGLGILLSPAAGAVLMSASTVVVAINASLLKVKN
jgi:P-type Cu2+ transporter